VPRRDVPEGPPIGSTGHRRVETVGGSRASARGRSGCVRCRSACWPPLWWRRWCGPLRHRRACVLRRAPGAVALGRRDLHDGVDRHAHTRCSPSPPLLSALTRPRPHRGAPVAKATVAVVRADVKGVVWRRGPDRGRGSRGAVVGEGDRRRPRPEAGAAAATSAMTYRVAPRASARPTDRPGGRLLALRQPPALPGIPHRRRHRAALGHGHHLEPPAADVHDVGLHPARCARRGGGVARGLGAARAGRDPGVGRQPDAARRADRATRARAPPPRRPTRIRTRPTCAPSRTGTAPASGPTRCERGQHPQLLPRHPRPDGRPHRAGARVRCGPRLPARSSSRRARARGGCRATGPSIRRTLQAAAVGWPVTRLRRPPLPVGRGRGAGAGRPAGHGARVAARQAGAPARPLGHRGQLRHRRCRGRHLHPAQARTAVARTYLTPSASASAGSTGTAGSRRPSSASGCPAGHRARWPTPRCASGSRARRSRVHDWVSPAAGARRRGGTGALDDGGCSDGGTTAGDDDGA
jgi:hypothetical protein